VIFSKIPLQDARIIEPERLEDHRGFYARGLCQREFANEGLVLNLVQSNISFTHKKGTLRGMHYQVAPHQEVKIVRCTRGAIFDVIIDMRPESSTYLKWFGVELNEENRKTLYIPGGFAQGFETLRDNTEVSYGVNEYYHPECEKGLRYNDPAFGIEWPFEPEVITDKDKSWPDYDS